MGEELKFVLENSGLAQDPYKDLAGLVQDVILPSFRERPELYIRTKQVEITVYDADFVEDIGVLHNQSMCEVISVNKNQDKTAHLNKPIQVIAFFP